MDFIFLSIWPVRNQHLHSSVLGSDRHRHIWGRSSYRKSINKAFDFSLMFLLSNSAVESLVLVTRDRLRRICQKGRMSFFRSGSTTSTKAVESDCSLCVSDRRKVSLPLAPTSWSLLNRNLKRVRAFTLTHKAWSIALGPRSTPADSPGQNFPEVPGVVPSGIASVVMSWSWLWSETTWMLLHCH